MIQALTHTIKKLKGKEDFRSQELRATKLRELKEVLKLETLNLTDELYNDKISLPKYLLKVEKLYSTLKDTQ
ncbi:hypothetical protein DRO03_10305 [Methanosarcinales archaeon]|nr:MAG: hypothetical protein DRO03_10305 [Methanosarcinales archaeon]